MAASEHVSDNQFVQYKLPKRFVDDHIQRDLLRRDAVVKSTAKHHVVSMNKEERDELVSDASYYSDSHREGDYREPEYRGLISSARAILKILGNE
jgi:hypothetical protein